MWESFNNPILGKIIEEAQSKMQDVSSDDDPTPEEGEGGSDGEQGLEKIIQGLQSGEITEEDLVKMYQSGKLTKDEVQQIITASQEGPQQEDLNPEELMAQQIDQVNDSFIRFSIYDKINLLEEKLRDFLENFTEVNSAIYGEVTQIQEFLKILNSLTFSLDVSVLYQMYGSIELKLIKLFDDFSKVQSKQISADKTKEIIAHSQEKLNFKKASDEQESFFTDVPLSKDE